MPGRNDGPPERHGEPPEDRYGWPPTTALSSGIRVIQNAIGIGTPRAIHVNESSLDRGFVLDHPVSKIGLYLAQKFSELRNDNIKIKVVGNSKISYRDNMFDDACIDSMKLSVMLTIAFKNLKFQGTPCEYTWCHCSINDNNTIAFGHAHVNNDVLDMNIVFGNKTKYRHAGYRSERLEFGGNQTHNLELMDPSTFNKIYSHIKEVENIKKLCVRTYQNEEKVEFDDPKTYEITDEIDLLPINGKIFL